jgi:hypothetical protein
MEVGPDARGQTTRSDGGHQNAQAQSEGDDRLHGQASPPLGARRDRSRMHPNPPGPRVCDKPDEETTTDTAQRPDAPAAGRAASNRLVGRGRTPMSPLTA